MLKNTLFICGTPFQLFLAQNIIRTEGIHNAAILYLGNPQHPKTKHYLALFAPNTSITRFWIDHELQHLKKRTISRKAKILAEQLGHPHNVFIANYTILFYSFLLSYLPFETLYSFDDGADNINPLSPLHQFHHQTQRQRLSYALKYGLRYRLKYQLRAHPKKILKNIKRHYTIFPQHPNIISAVRPLKLQALTPTPAHSTLTPRPVIKLFIGAYFSDMFTRSTDLTSLMAQLHRLFHDQKIDAYLPHPREHTHHLPNAQHIDILAEEYVLTQIAAGRHVELYGFASTVQLNLAHREQVTNHLITSASLHPKIRHLYEHICDDRFNLIDLPTAQTPNLTKEST